MVVFPADTVDVTSLSGYLLVDLCFNEVQKIFSLIMLYSANLLSLNT